MILTNQLDMYTTNILVETLPKSQRTEETLSKLGLAEGGKYIVLQLLLSRDLKNLIDSMNGDKAISWKEDFHQCIKESLENYRQEYYKFNLISLLNLQPMIRTLVIHIDREKVGLMNRQEGLNEVLTKLFNGLNSKTEERYHTKFTGCFGTSVEDFFYIGKSYKGARQLQDYHFIIGKGKCAFIDFFTQNEKHSLLEYKYLRLFEDALRGEDWVGVEELLLTIKNNLIKHRMLDSKTTYLYKELYSVTIRQLFLKPDQYKEEIEMLNLGIIHFDSLFDDVNEIHDYYMKVFNIISEISQYDSINPHIRKSLQIIQTRYNQAISLEEVADELGLTKEYLSRLFKKEVESNFKSYLTRVRLEKAKGLLKESKKDINHIRDAVGYQSPSQFVRAFKAYEGMTPSKYRQISRHR